MADRYSYLVTNDSRSYGRTMRNEDFSEEDVWGVHVTQESNNMVKKPRDSPSVSTLRRLPTASRLIPRASKPSSVHEVQQQSAPVNIPDWSNIYNKNPKKGSHSSWVDDDENDDGDASGDVGAHNNMISDDEDEDDEWIPPHEWIAKKLARSRISSFSVCEGVGRTLKGRDLSRVRNAVLSRTGFLES